MAEPAKKIKVSQATAVAFQQQESGADGLDGLEYVDTVQEGFDNHDTPEWQLILRRASNGALYSITYQADSEGYSSLEEWPNHDAILVERKEKVVHYYEAI